MDDENTKVDQSITESEKEQEVKFDTGNMFKIDFSHLENLM